MVGRVFSLFAFLWASSGLLDLVTGNAWLSSPLHLALTASCCAVMLRPGSRFAFAALTALRVAAFVEDSPLTPNHQVLYAVAGLTILWTGAAVVARRARPPDWLEAFAPWLRVELLLLYFFAVLHKLNRDYLDPSVSCAVDLFGRAAPDWLEAALPAGALPRAALIAGSLAAEIGIPLALLVPRARRSGLAAGLLFHAFLGRFFYAFSTGVFAFYVLFVPVAALDACAARWAGWRAARGRLGVLAGPAALRVACLALGLGIGALWTATRLGLLAHGPALGTALVDVWLVGMVAAGALLLSGPASTWRAPAPGRLRVGPALLFPLLLGLCGMAPYLGLRTAPAFSMFSNLRTEGGLTNHLFVPARALRVASYTDDLVVILYAEDEELQEFARNGRRRPFHQLKQRIQWMAKRGKRDIVLHYRRGGRTLRLAQAERDPELMEEITLLERKLLRFRPLPIGGPRDCDW